MEYVESNTIPDVTIEILYIEFSKEIIYVTLTYTHAILLYPIRTITIHILILPYLNDLIMIFLTLTICILYFHSFVYNS